MPPKNIELTNGTLYFDRIAVPTEIGELTVEELEVAPVIESVVIRPLPYEEVTLTATMDYHTWLSLLLGKRVTNNWLKMHGGVMRRGRWRK